MRTQSTKSVTNDVNQFMHHLVQQEEMASEIAAQLPDAVIEYGILKCTINFIRLRRNLFLKKHPNNLQGNYALTLQKRLDGAEAKIKSFNIQKSFALACQFLAFENEFDDATFCNIEKLKSACAIMKKRAELLAIRRGQKTTLLSALSSQALRILTAELDKRETIMLTEKKSRHEKQLHELQQLRSDIAVVMFNQLMCVKKN